MGNAIEATAWQGVVRTAPTRGAVARLVVAMLATLVILAGMSRAAQPAAPAPSAAPSVVPSVVPAARFAKNVAIITVSREIDRVMARSIQRRINEAVKSKADAIVFELDTPGGEIGAVLDITRMIRKCPIPNTVAWVHDQAYSGGALIALACREIVVSESARMGDALPIMVQPGLGGGQLRPLRGPERQKILAPLLTDVVESARLRGYDEKLVQGMVTPGIELWMIENVDTGQKLFIDAAEHTLLFGAPPEGESLALPSVPPGDGEPTRADRRAADAGQPPRDLAEHREPTDLIPAGPSIADDTARTASLALTLPSTRPALTRADGPRWRKVEKVSDGDTIYTFTPSQMQRFGLASREVKTDDELRAFFGATNMGRLNQSWSETLVLFLSGLLVRGLLIVVFLVALFIAMTHPGLFMPEVIAMVALGLLIAPAFLNDMASWWEIAAMLLGVLLLIMEIFVIPGFGVCGILGIVLFLGGLVGTFIGAGSGGLFPGSAEGSSPLISAVTTVVLSAASAFGIMWFIAKHFGSIPMLNKLVLQDDGGADAGDGAGLLAAMAAADAAVSPGAMGVALTPLRPAGRVQIGDQIVDVVSDFGFIKAGAAVRVARVEQFRITVEPVGDAQAGASGATPA